LENLFLISNETCVIQLLEAFYFSDFLQN